MQEIVLDFNKIPVYEAGAILLTTLAYPQPHEEKQRELPRRAYCALALRARCEVDSEWANAPQLIKPIHACMSDRDIGRALKTMQRRLRDRMIAGRMAMAFLKEAATGKLPKLPETVKRLSVNEISQLVADDAGQADSKNVETRIWRASLPVVHLAAACQAHMQATERALGTSIHVGHLIADRPIIEQLVRAAEEYRLLLEKSTRIAIDTDTQVKLSLA